MGTTAPARAPGNSLSSRLTWMNLLVSGTALLLASTALVVYDIVTFRNTMV